MSTSLQDDMSWLKNVLENIAKDHGMQITHINIEWVNNVRGQNNEILYLRTDSVTWPLRK